MNKLCLVLAILGVPLLLVGICYAVGLIGVALYFEGYSAMPVGMLIVGAGGLWSLTSATFYQLCLEHRSKKR